MHYLKKKNPVFNANIVGPDQTPRSAASDLGLNYLQMSPFWNAMYKWVNNKLHLRQTLQKRRILLKLGKHKCFENSRLCFTESIHEQQCSSLLTMH